MRVSINWSIDDPESVSGTPEEKLEKMRRVRDMIKEKVLAFIRDFEATSSF